MNTTEIEVLIEKFFEGNTSLPEEERLREFFKNQDIPAHLESYRELFAGFVNAKQEELKDLDFEIRLTEKLSNDLTTPVIQLRPNRNRMIFITSIAAGVLILMGLYFTFQNDLMEETYTQSGNPGTEIAYADASEALLLVSGNLNNGLKQVEKLQMVDKAMKNMQLFNKFYQVETIIINPDLISNQSIKSK
jgi:hypothetical protein